MKNDSAHISFRQSETELGAMQRRLSNLYDEAFGIERALETLPQGRRISDAGDCLVKALAFIEEAQAYVNVVVSFGEDREEHDYPHAQEMEDKERRHERSL